MTSLPSNLQNLKIVATTEMRMVNRSLGTRIRTDAGSFNRYILNYSPNFADNLKQVWAQEVGKFFINNVVDTIIGKTQRDIETTFYGAFQILNEYYAELIKDQLLPWESISVASHTQGLRKFGVYTGSLISSLVAVMGDSLAKSNYKTIVSTGERSKIQSKRDAVIHGLLAVQLDNQKRYERARGLLAVARAAAAKEYEVVDIHDTGENVASYGYPYLRSISDKFNRDEIQAKLQNWVEQFARESLASGRGIEIRPGASQTTERLKQETARLHAWSFAKILMAAQNRRRWVESQMNNPNVRHGEYYISKQQEKNSELSQKQAEIMRRMYHVLAKLGKNEEISPDEIRSLIGLEQSLNTGNTQQTASLDEKPSDTNSAEQGKNTPRALPTKGDTEKTISHPVPNPADRTTTTTEPTVNLATLLKSQEARDAINLITSRINTLKAQAANGGLPYAENAEQANRIAVEYRLVRNPDFVDGEAHIYVINEILNALYSLKQQYNLPEIDVVGSAEAVSRQFAIWKTENAELNGRRFTTNESKNQYVQEQYNQLISEGLDGSPLMYVYAVPHDKLGVKIGLAVNTLYYDSNVALIYNELANQKAVAERWFVPRGSHKTSVEHTVWHETGHLIHDLLGIVVNTKDSSGNLISVSRSREIQKLYNFLKQTPEAGKYRISKYAMTNIMEFIAESWAEYHGNPNGARTDAQLVAQRLIAYMNEKFKK